MNITIDNYENSIWATDERENVIYYKLVNNRLHVTAAYFDGDAYKETELRWKEGEVSQAFHDWYNVINEEVNKRYNALKNEGKSIDKENPLLLPIEVEYANIVQRFNDNHNKDTYFKKDDVGYWTLIHQSVNVAMEMAQHFQSMTPSSHRDDKITVFGGGGGNEVYHIDVMHKYLWWTLSVGAVYINFKTKEITVEHQDIPHSKRRYQYNGIPYEEFFAFLAEQE